MSIAIQQEFYLRIFSKRCTCDITKFLQDVNTEVLFPEITFKQCYVSYEYLFW